MRCFFSRFDADFCLFVYGLGWTDLVGFSMFLGRFGLVWFGSVRFGPIRFGSIWFDSVRFGSVRFDSVWFGLVGLGLV